MLRLTLCQQIHWPVNFASTPDPKSLTGVALEPNADGLMKLDEKLSLVDTWKKMIELQKAGKIRR